MVQQDSMKNLTNCYIQPDFTDCIEDVRAGKLATADFYVNIDSTPSQLVEYIIKIALEGEKLVFDAGPGNSFRAVGSEVFECNLDGSRFTFRIAKTSRRDSSRKDLPSFTCIDQYESDGDYLYATGDQGGIISIYDSQAEVTRTLEGHYAEITDVKFFPSGEVLLSGSADMQLKVWSTLDGSNPRTLKGHTSTVTALGIIDRGRNVMSSSKDGSLKLWECGSGETIHSFARKTDQSDPVNDMLILCSPGSSEDGSRHLEFGTAGKTVFAGHNSGFISYHDIRSKDLTFELPNQFESPCCSLASSTSQFHPASQSPVFLYAGYDNGTVAQWDIRKPEKPVESLLWNAQTPISSLYSRNGKLFASSGSYSSVVFDVDFKSGNMQHPTFLVTGETAPTAYAGLTDRDNTLAVGEGGFWAIY